MATTRSTESLIWIDCEMTGLDRENDKIMSICCFITDADLNIIDDKGWEAVIHHDASFLDRMDPWCTRTHGKSGLTKACIESTLEPQEAATGLLSYISKHVKAPHKALLAGNSVHCDKEFLMKPPYDIVIRNIHHRILDVSSIKEAARRWASEDVLKQVPRKKGLHQAREDILESIEEAKFYRDAFFKSKSTST